MEYEPHKMSQIRAGADKTLFIVKVTRTTFLTFCVEKVVF